MGPRTRSSRNACDLRAEMSRSPSRPIAAASQKPPRGCSAHRTDPLAPRLPGIRPAMRCAPMIFAGFGDTVPVRSSEYGACHAAILATRHCHAGCAGSAGRRPAKTAAQRVPGDGECAAARHAGQPATDRREGRGGDDLLCRPFDLLHRVARRRADRDRLQRRLPDRPPARRRHHEPRPLHALLAEPGPRHRACAARLGR